MTSFLNYPTRAFGSLSDGAGGVMRDCTNPLRFSGRRAFSTGSSLAMLAGTAIAGLVIMAPLAGYELVTQGIDTSRPVDILFVLYLALGPSALAYLLVGYGLTHIEASLASIYGNVMPISGAVAGYLLLDEHIGVAHLVGGLFIILGVWLASRKVPTSPAVVITD